MGRTGGSFGVRSGRRTLLVGPAGSGKTRVLLRLARWWAAFDRPDGDSEGRALLVLPTYGQAQHVRRLVLLSDRSRDGFFDEPIVTFSSLAERVVGHPLRRMLSAAEKDLLLRRVLLDAPPGFAGVARYAGFRSLCLEVLKEVKENGLGIEEAAAVVRGKGEALGGSARERLEALADVLVRYQRVLDEAGLLDHEDLLVRLRDALLEPGDDLRRWLARLQTVAFDGFTDFTRVEREILRLLADRAGRCWVTLTIGAGDRGDLFHATEETREWLEGQGFRTRRLRSSRRFRRADLAALEDGLFRTERREAVNDGGIETIVATDIEDEVDRIARRVVRMMREDGRRPHEIGIVVRGWEGYRDLLPEAFERHDVPLLLHAGLPLGGEPCVRAAEALLHVVADGWPGEEVRSLLRLGALGPDPDDVDALLRSLAGRSLPEGRDAWLAAAAAAPSVREALEAIAEEEDALFASPAASALAERVRGWWGHLLHLEGTGSDGGAAAREAEALRTFSGLLAGVVRALGAAGEPEPGLVAFARAVHDAIERIEVRSRSRRFETVHAISVQEARQWELPVVIVAGLLEGTFPRRPREDIFLRDRERAELNREGRLSLKEKLRTVDEERYLFYVAATRARERLILTRPAADRDGSPLLPSFFFRDLRRAFDGESLDRHTTERQRASLSPRADEATGPADLRRRALLGLGEPWVPGSATEREAVRAALLADRLRIVDATFRADLTVGVSLRETPRAVLRAPDVLATVARLRRSFSATTLRTFAHCPFQDFARSTLGLAERETRGIGFLDLGNVAHAALRTALADPVDPGEAFDAAVAAALGDREADLTADRELRDMRERVIALVESEHDRRERQGLRTVALEHGFGGDEVVFGGVPLRGQLDRVDETPAGVAVVLDYKRTVPEARVLPALEDGRDFQLTVYLAAAREALGLRPTAAVLMPVVRGVPRGIVRSDVPPLPEGGRYEELEPEAFDALLERAAGTVAEIAARVQAGTIEARPRDTQRCERGLCPYLDLCRVERWQLEAERAEESS